MMITDAFPLLGEGLRVAAGAASRGFRPPPERRFEGDAAAICSQVTKACWNGRYFQAGGDHFNQFWIRDFALALPGLIDLGLLEEARATLEFAMNAWARTGRITTTVLSTGQAVDVFRLGADSLPFLLYAASLTDQQELLEQHGDLIGKALAGYGEAFFDSQSGQYRLGVYFPTAKDMITLPGNCAGFAFVAWTDAQARRLGMASPFPETDFEQLLHDTFWEKDHYSNDPGSRILSADANLWPFWCGVVRDPVREQKAIRAVQNAGLDRPFPLKYHATRHARHEHWVSRIIVPNYQGDTIWTMLTLQWIERVALYDLAKARHYLEQTALWIEKYGNWIELFEPDGSKPFRGPFGHGAAQGLIWAANFPRLWRSIRG